MDREKLRSLFFTLAFGDIHKQGGGKSTNLIYVEQFSKESNDFAKNIQIDLPQKT